jgi:hypothetical protein
MNMKGILIRNIALMVVFGSIGLTKFAENVRTVQVVGLFASGAVCGVAFALIISISASSRAAKSSTAGPVSLSDWLGCQAINEVTLFSLSAACTPRCRL